MKNEKKLPEANVHIFGKDVHKDTAAPVDPVVKNTEEKPEKPVNKKGVCEKTHGGVTFGLLAIFAGIILVANNLGIIPWEFWDVVVRFWPVLLILWGIRMIIGHSLISRIFLFIITLFALLCVTAYGIIDSSPRLPTGGTYQKFEYNIPAFPDSESQLQLQ